MTRTVLRRVPIAVLVILACAVSARDGMSLRHSAEGAPSFGHELLAAYRLPRVAGRLSAGLPVFLAPPPVERMRGLLTPWRVGIQAGHWKIDELPLDFREINRAYRRLSRILNYLLSSGFIFQHGKNCRGIQHDPTQVWPPRGVLQSVCLP